MKIYLVSEVYSFSDERMYKKFEVFETKEAALEYKEAVKEAIIIDLLNLENLEDEDELFEIYEETYDYESCWGYLNPDCSEEFELEITELNLLTWKEN